MVVSVRLTSFRIRYRLIAGRVDGGGDLNINLPRRGNIAAPRNLSICIVGASWNRDADSGQERAAGARERCGGGEHAVSVLRGSAGLERRVEVDIRVWGDGGTRGAVEG